MKKRVLIGTVFVILLCLITGKVQAFTGTLNEGKHIYLPSTISGVNGVYTGTINVYGLENYTISYQAVNMTETEYNNLVNKNDEEQEYYDSASAELKQKEDNVKALADEYTTINGSDTATDEDKQAARDAYNNAVDDYNAYRDTINARLQELKNEYLALLPDYDDTKWIQTTNESGNVTLDFSNNSGKIYFALWGKAESGSDAYYNVNIYSQEVKKSSNGNSEVVKSPLETAKVTVEQLSNVRNYRFLISDITPETNYTYYYTIGDGTSVPEFSTDYEQLKYDNTKKVFYSGTIEKYLEIAKDQYVYVYARHLNDNSEFENELIVEKAKLEKPAQKKYTDVFYATIMTKLSADSEGTAQILFNTPWDKATVRKVHLRIGKISDDTILKDIYNKKSNAFENLLAYSKTKTAIFDKTLNSNASDTAAGGIISNNVDNWIDASSITDDEYYFLYAVVEDENGKYVKTEGVTLARASKPTNDSFQLNFYDSTNFSWKSFDSGDTEPSVSDKTISPKTLPNTGSGIIVLVLGVIATVGGIVSYALYKKNNY